MQRRSGNEQPPRRARQLLRSRRREPPDAGSAPRAWFIARDKADETLAIGLSRPWLDPYYLALRLPWWQFLIAGAALYLAANTLFALLYLAQSGAIANARPGAFADAFFFSVQTMSTVGYGGMSPATTWANLVVTAESMVGLMFVALATGLVFARFSRPTARVLFSRVAVISPHNRAPTLSLRLANRRRNQILEAQVDVALLRDEETSEGETIRRLHDLKLARHRTPSFAMTFTVTHRIDRDSPLHGATAASLAAENAELVVTVSGIDDTISARVNARTSYLADEILWGHRFVDVIGWTDYGRRVIDYRRFHDTIPPTTDR